VIAFGKDVDPFMLHIYAALAEQERRMIKWLSMLREVVPGLKRVAFLANPDFTTYDFYLRASQAPDVYTVSHSEMVIAAAARHRLPAVFAFGYLVTNGGLMSYGTDRIDEMRQTASYIDRLLRGDKPGELPVQLPTKFETFINLKTAKALGLVMPSGLLLAADEIIE